MSLPETLDTAHTWTPERLLECVDLSWSTSHTLVEQTRQSVTEFLSASGNIAFGFDELMQCIGNTMPLEGNEEHILRLMACLFMRLDIEDLRKPKLGRDYIYSTYRRGLERLNIEAPKISTSAIIDKKPAVASHSWRSFFWKKAA